METQMQKEQRAHGEKESPLELGFVSGDSPQAVKIKLRKLGISFRENGTSLNTLLIVSNSCRAGLSGFKSAFHAPYTAPEGVFPWELTKRYGSLTLVDKTPKDMNNSAFSAHYTPVKREVYIQGTTTIKFE